MPFGTLFGRGAVFAAALGVVGLTATPQPAHAISAGEAAGIGVGAFALGTILSQPTYNPYYYPGYAYPAPGYYYGAPSYYPGYAPRSCWDPYYRRYYAC